MSMKEYRAQSDETYPLQEMPIIDDEWNKPFLGEIYACVSFCSSVYGGGGVCLEGSRGLSVQGGLCQGDPPVR